MENGEIVVRGSDRARVTPSNKSEILVYRITLDVCVPNFDVIRTFNCILDGILEHKNSHISWDW